MGISSKISLIVIPSDFLFCFVFSLNSPLTSDNVDSTPKHSAVNAITLILYNGSKDCIKTEI